MWGPGLERCRAREDRAQGSPSWPKEGSGSRVPPCVVARQVWPRRCHQARHPLMAALVAMPVRDTWQHPRLLHPCILPQPHSGVPAAPLGAQPQLLSLEAGPRPQSRAAASGHSCLPCPRPHLLISSPRPLWFSDPHQAQMTHSVPLSPHLPDGPQTRSLLPALHLLYCFH